MKKLLFALSAALLLSISWSASAATPPDVSIASTVTDAIQKAASGSLLSTALTWLSCFVGLQFIITNLGLLKSGADLEAIIGKFLGSMLWFGVCFYIFKNGPDFIDSVGHDILEKFAPDIPGPGTIITATLGISTTLVAAIFAIGAVHTAVANLLIYIVLIVFGVGMYLAIKVMMLSLELGLIVMLSPLSFSFLGLNALKDQGIAPFKSLISLVYRIILLGIIYGAFDQVIAVCGHNLADIAWKNPLAWPGAINVIMSMLCAFPVIGFLVYKSDSIASSLASGATNLGAADVASAAAAGAAAGAAVGSASGGALNLPGKTVQSVGDAMKNMMGGGSVSNASPKGFGGESPMSDAPRRPPSMPDPTAKELRAQRSEAAAAKAGPASGAPQATGRSTVGVDNDTAPVRPTPQGNSQAMSSNPTPTGLTEQEASDVRSNISGGDVAKATTTDTAPARAAVPGDSGSSAPQRTEANFKPFDGAPVRPAAPDHSRAPQRPEGSGAAAGISGGATLGQNAGQPQAAKASAWGKLGKANEHLAQEKAATQVSISTHHSD